MRSRELTIDEIMAILPATVPRLTELTDGVRACHDVFGGNILRILAEEQPTWKGMSPRAWIRRTDYPEWEFRPALEAFARQRADLLH